MKKQLFSTGMALAMVIGCAFIAFAQEKPETLVKQRQAVMTLQAKYFGPLMRMAQGKMPYDADIVARNAAYLNVLDKMPWDGFDASTKGVESSRALPKVFTDTAGVMKAKDRLIEAVDKLAALKPANVEAVKKAIMEVGNACGSCHDNFRRSK